MRKFGLISSSLCSCAVFLLSPANVVTQYARWQIVRAIFACGYEKKVDSINHAEWWWWWWWWRWRWWGAVDGLGLAGSLLMATYVVVVVVVSVAVIVFVGCLMFVFGCRRLSVV